MIFFRCAFDRLSRIESKQQKEEGMAFLCGFICHYIGDSICHPYVYGRIGYDVQNPGDTTMAFMPSWKMILTPFF